MEIKVSSESKKQMRCFFIAKNKKSLEKGYFCPLKPVISEGIFFRKSRKGGDNQ